MTLSASLILLAYLLGSISSAIIVSRIMGLPDPRTMGSGNPGATNVLRTGSKKAAAITLIGDALKGLIPVLLAKTLVDDANIIALVAAAAFIGHLYPVFFGFKGGKGVATALGVFLAVSFPVGLMLAASWALIAYITKISSISALIAACLSPIYMSIVVGESAYTAMAVFLSVMLVYRHKNNIKDLMSGKEGKITDKE
ncbi:MAG: glycerol-3-phosphate 1-O-acyltransferase PlsY [Gammaproteobacteria bacterium]|nr:glycerol-3-phosphate 1-O-acyltransferase PlsY [Gammaproteobacteria bacterium]